MNVRGWFKAKDNYFLLNFSFQKYHCWVIGYYIEYLKSFPPIYIPTPPSLILITKKTSSINSLTFPTWKQQQQKKSCFPITLSESLSCQQQPRLQHHTQKVHLSFTRLLVSSLQHNLRRQYIIKIKIRGITPFSMENPYSMRKDCVAKIQVSFKKKKKSGHPFTSIKKKFGISNQVSSHEE